MSERAGDHITVGNVTNAQGVAIGRGASAIVHGVNLTGETRMDPAELRAVLSELYGALGQAGLPMDKMISAQTAVGTALESVQSDQVAADPVVTNVQRVGDVLKEATTTVERGTALWSSVQKLAPLLGPLVGGAPIVASWFGGPLR